MQELSNSTPEEGGGVPPGQPHPGKIRPIAHDETAKLNVSDEALLEQVSTNIRRHLPQVQPDYAKPVTILLVCGGPSLVETEHELVEAYWAGGKIVTVNGAYEWCVERNLKPSGHIQLDAREFNSRFIARPVPGCKYFLAAQSHPRTFEMCRDRETYIWHACSGGQEEVDLIEEYYFGHVHPITMGIAVGTRAIALLRMIGFIRQDVFGMDSCVLDKEHHSYAQPENDVDGNTAIPVWIRPKGRDDKAARFMCSRWHVSQAEDFMRLVRKHGGDLFLSMRGRGMLAAIMRAGAEIELDKLAGASLDPSIGCLGR